MPDLVNPYTPWGVTSAYPGSIVSVFGSNLAPPFAGTPTITIGGLPATLTSAVPHAQINLRISLNQGPSLAQQGMHLNKQQIFNAFIPWKRISI